mmetsp:Transcript_29408/g.90131  ORF Transcript_29408/g.90131 Transcript_29408/m.90131 type:complete len:117 (+) Transcript_29408:456-806(+)
MEVPMIRKEEIADIAHQGDHLGNLKSTSWDPRDASWHQQDVHLGTLNDRGPPNEAEESAVAKGHLAQWPRAYLQCILRNKRYRPVVGHRHVRFAYDCSPGGITPRSFQFPSHTIML